VKRDMDFVRELLLRVESDPELDGYHWKTFNTSDFSPRSNEEVAYHVDLLIDAGLLVGSDPTMDAESTPISRLTWDGHEFADNIKDMSIWKRVKARIDGLPGVAVKVIAAVAESEIKKHLGLV
jgi:hypothetical protein